MVTPLRHDSMYVAMTVEYMTALATVDLPQYCHNVYSFCSEGKILHQFFIVLTNTISNQPDKEPVTEYRNSYIPTYEMSAS